MKIEKVSKHIISWLKEYAENAKVNGFVVGVSGGIDSAVTSTLCASTGFPTLCVEMPIHQAESQVSRAKEHIAQLKERFDNVSDLKVDLTTTFENFKNVVPVVASSDLIALSLANTRARIRMTSLYYLAGIHNSLVIGTGNKVEDFGVGFYTKYGDGGVDISPIADLNKTDVFEISKILGVLDEIIKAKPTDGLWDDGRTDEDQIGATYKELEWAMQQKDLNKKLIDFKGREKEVFQILKKFNKQNLHKMNPIPIYKVPEILK